MILFIYDKIIALSMVRKKLTDKQIEKLAKRVAKTFSIDEEEAISTIYEEWDLVEQLFHAHTKVKAVHRHLVEEINYAYRIA